MDLMTRSEEFVLQDPVHKALAKLPSMRQLLLTTFLPVFGLHSHDIRWTPLVSLLVANAPGQYQIPHVAALVGDFSIVAHSAGLAKMKGKDVVARRCIRCVDVLEQDTVW